MSIDLVVSMRVFTAVVEAGSFVGAAEKLGLSRGMATRYVAGLEEHLGVRLLHRTTRKLSLTEAGIDYNERATQVLSMIAEAESSVAQEASAPRGILKVSSSNAFGARHLGMAITAYLQQYPGVQVDVTLSDRVVDLVEEGFDVAIRVAPRIDQGLVARKLARVKLVVCASPDYLKSHGMPMVPEDLVKHQCLTYSYVNSPNEWRFRREGLEQKIMVSGNLWGNSGDILRSAAVEGLGITLQPDFMIYEALRERKLVRVLSDWDADELGVFAVYPNRKFLPPKVRSFIDFLVERLGPEPYWSIDAPSE
jgi:DNA-binding transcriptional LysR family regulator